MAALFSGVIGAVAGGDASTGTKYETIQTIPQLNAWIDKICKAGHVSFDTETDSIHANQANIVGMSLAIVRGEAAYIPLGHDNGEQLALHDVLQALQPVLENPCILKIMHNGKYDWLVMKRYGVTIHPIEDTMLMSYSQYGGKHFHNMDDLSARYLGHTTIEFKEVTGGRPFNEVELAPATAYAAEDADVTLGMYEVFGQTLLEDRQSLNVYRNLEQPLLPVLARMEREGVLLDVPFLNELTADFTKKMNATLDPMYEAAGVEFNPASAKQLGAVFKTLGIDTGERTDTGQMATGAKVLDKLAERVDLPDNAKRLVTHVLEWRKFAKLIGTYTEALPAAINPHTGRLHPSFVMVGTITGRLSCSDPNIQNIPIRTPEGALLRNAFIAAPGNVIISADYSQIELRILAEASGDPGLLHAFAEGHDIHAATASLVLNKPIEDVSKTERRDMKAVNFGIAYGSTEYGLARNLGITPQEALTIIEQYFQRFPGIKGYMEKAVAMARRRGFVRTRDGRRIWIEDIGHKFRGKRSHAERQAVNGPIQGTAADMMKRAMIAMDHRLTAEKFKTKMLLQVHDELIFEAPEDEAARAMPVIKEVMEAASTMRVKVIAEVGVGPNWGAAH